MAKRIIDPQLAEALRANPNVEKVTRKSIAFKGSFINRALDQYLLGGKPRIEIFEEARTAISDYIDYYNNVRPQIGLGRMTPREKRDCLLSRPPCLATLKACPKGFGNRGIMGNSPKRRAD